MEYKYTILNRTLTFAVGVILIGAIKWLFSDSKDIMDVILWSIVGLSFLIEVYDRKLYVPLFIHVDTWYKKVITFMDKYSFGFILLFLTASKFFHFMSIVNAVFASFVIFRYIKYGRKYGYLKK